MHHSKIRELLDELFIDIKFDHALYAKVCAMEMGFVNKKPEHIEFFGGTLTGVEVVRFTPSDRDKLFHEILQIDEKDLEEKVYALKDDHGKPLINQDWVVTRDVFNMCCIWLIHGFERSKILKEEQRHEAKVRVGCYLYYKFLTSLLAHYFKFPADREIARATYEALSFKYALKQLGSWGETIRDLADKAVSKESVYRDTIERMDDDQRIIRMVGDLQGRIRDMLKNIYAEFVRVHQSGGRIASSSSLVASDNGEMILRDNLKSPGVYARYLKSVVSDKNSFIRPELVDVIASCMHTLVPRLLTQTLVWTSDNFLHAKDGRIEKAIDLVLEHAIEYMAINRAMARTDLAGMIDRLRGAYMSSRSTDHKLLQARQLIGEMVKEATHSRNDSAIATVRTAWMLYIVSRAYSMHHYANQ